MEPYPISALNRKNIEAVIEETNSFLENDGVTGFILPNGRIIRTVDNGEFSFLFLFVENVLIS